MPSKRVLPARHSPFVESEHSPSLDQLIERRRLGRTNLSAKPTQVGVANATKAENLGPFDYAHLRVPLPRDLEGSGIHFLKENGKFPETYFLMRRSKDGYVSATGMFKAAYPWASIEEDEAERKHHKSLPTAGPEEVAGNVWIHPEQALVLADEYDMRDWIVALLDSEPIQPGTKVTEKIEIATPPKFVFGKDVLLPPPTSSTRGSTRKRSTRSASPSKIATPSRKIASPRKPRASRKKKTDDDAASVASSTLQNVVENGTHDLTPAPESIDGAIAAANEGGAVVESVKVGIDEVVTKDGDKEITKTSVVIDMPAGYPELPLPENTEDMLAKAQEIVERAVADDNKAALANGVKTTRKRKAEEVEADDEVAEASGAAAPSSDALVQPAAKKTKMLEANLKREKVRTRAMIGIGFTMAIGAVIPYFL